MQLRRSELTPARAPGLVSFFEADRVFGDPCAYYSLGPGGSPYMGLRPFVFVASNGYRAVAMPLTTKGRRERMQIRRAWKSGLGKWRQRDNFVADHACILVLPIPAWIEASKAEISSAGERMRVSVTGVEAILRASASDGYRHNWQGNPHVEGESRGLYVSACNDAGIDLSARSMIDVDYWLSKAAEPLCRPSRSTSRSTARPSSSSTSRSSGASAA